MQNDFIDMIESTPELKSKKCRLISLLLKLFFQYFIYIVGLGTWFFYDWFMAIASLILGFVVMGIIRSKIRNSVIPIKQREYQYSDKEIADWYVSKELCIDELERNLEKIK